MFVKIEECPICKNTSYENFIICKDHSVSGESFAIVQCTNCGLKYTNPRPDEQVIGQYYESEDYISHANKANSLINRAYKFVRKYTLRSKVNLIRNLIKNEVSLLDIGCGTGEFIKVSLDQGWEVSGVETSEKARAAAKELTGLKVSPSIEDIEGKYNVITLWHVLEHMPDLDHTLQIIKSHLKKNGKIIIAVPNADSHDAMTYKEYWAGYDVPRHFYHFTQKTMKRLMKNHKLKISKVVPMKYDSYYISLLSEKYRYGSNNYLKSVLSGYKSNSYAEKNENNFSSLTYIINK